ncbi:hypothetical protein BCR33DRAFT_721934 [Rhizoclosmatium globosum]|uniref:Sulfatase-modifying factor enzyme-like domain-containing protein n=1 Tax=Rhizoclosmatium globosum TaxID=329046 RepID=A0A1Y2BPQ1_9FUNG|nr:hypothetical protein BCR33DRAFT_721934 [Rhizoclosmatium globosum]|eukprot:ORY36723.1 hypothetical protein BCR33DRAFT_721934 [Rhizoclosmatium globosum]
MIPQDGYLEKPISLRHPYIFYLGHLPAFMDIQLSRCLSQPFTEPVSYTEIFERGIDPDINDPSIVHPHSKVPDTWPTLSEILEYSEKCKTRIRKHLRDHESGAVPASGPLARILWMSYEHYAMHLETFLYMLAPVHLFRKHTSPVKPIASATLRPISFPQDATSLSIGHNDAENDDKALQSRKVTIGEYAAFLSTTPSPNPSLIPSSWTPTSGTYTVKTVFGPVPYTRVLNWPANVSYDQAAAYAKYISTKTGKLHRLPTEPELTCDRLHNQPTTTGNYGFRAWTPRDVSDADGVVGDGWEWTQTCMDAHEGYVKSLVYPGYTSDFFDGKHNVLIGASWATAPRLTRGTFRNWYQRGYTYVFAGFRLVVEDA